MRVELHPEAEAELFEAAAWYDSRRPGLGDEFLAEADRWIDVISESPGSWPRWPGAPPLEPPARRAIIDRFPYATAYQVLPGRVRVLAFAHTSRRPFYWAKRSGW